MTGESPNLLHTALLVNCLDICIILVPSSETDFQKKCLKCGPLTINQNWLAKCFWHVIYVAAGCSLLFLNCALLFFISGAVVETCHMKRQV